MKSQSQVRCILFSLLVPLAACGSPSSSDKPASGPLATKREPAPGVRTVDPAESVVTPSADPPAAKAVVELVIPKQLSECMRLGKELEAKGDHAQARTLFEAAAKLDRKQAEPLIELARSYIATNDKGLAIKVANKAVKLAPESSQAYNTLGRAELLRHDYDAAILAFRQATELNPDNVWAWNNLGLAQLTLKNYQEAANALVEATSHKGAESYMWNNLGLAYEQLDELDDARDAFEQGAKLGSDVARASRKRLEGVDTIVVAKATKAEPKAEPGAKAEQTYELREPMPELTEDADADDAQGTDDPELQGTDDSEPVPTPAPTTL